MDRLDTQQEHVLTTAMGLFSLALVLGLFLLGSPTPSDLTSGAPATDAGAPLRRAVS